MKNQMLSARPEIAALATQLIGAALGFGAIALLARRLDASALGVWMLYLSLSTFVEMLRSGVFAPALVRELAVAEEGARQELCAAALALALSFSLPVAVLAVAASLLVSGEAPLFVCGALLAVVAAPGQHALAVQQATGRFDRILCLRLLPSALFLAWLLADLCGDSPARVAAAHLVAHGSASLLAGVCGWNGLRGLHRVRRADVSQLLRFGRYSVGTLAATSLLRGLDPWLIGSLAGPAAVATYGLPMKLIELVEIPIRGFAATAYPGFAALARREGYAAVEAAAWGWSRRLTLLLAPLVGGLMLGAPLALAAVGGGGESSVAVLRVLCLYGLLLPLDRALGLALDAIGRPGANLRKVTAMAVLNGLGDIVALKLGAPLEAVAAVSVLMTWAGIALGRRAVRRAAHSASPSDAGAGAAGYHFAGRANGR